VSLPKGLPLRDGKLVLWRLDDAQYAKTWDSGEGAFRFGGRWNSRGVWAVYCATDPSTAILEVAVHKGFDALDKVNYVLTAATVEALDELHVVAAVPNRNWLVPARPSAAQQAFGDALLARHKFVLLPSVVSPHSWNVIFVAEKAAGAYRLKSQDPLALDTRLNPPA
jgi:RES domain-containing protein